MDHSITASPAGPAAPAAPPVAPRLRDRKGQVYEPAVGPRLKWLLALIFFGFALLGASGLYMLAITLLDLAYTPNSWFNNLLGAAKTPKVFTNSFTLLIIL